MELGLKRDKDLKRDVTCGSGWALTKIISEPSAILGRYDPFILQVTLVPHKDDLGIIPGVGLDLRGPVELWTLRRRLKVGGGRAKACGISVVGQHSPVLHSGEGLLVGNVIHEQEAHGSTVVGCGDGPVALLACCVLGKQQSVSWGSSAPYLTLQGPERDTGLSLWSNLMGRHGPALSALAAHPGVTHYRLHHQAWLSRLENSAN